MEYLIRIGRNILNKIKQIGIKKIILISIGILGLLLLTSIIVAIIQDKALEKKVNEKDYTNISDFESIKEVAVYMGCKYISDDGKTINLNFNRDLYDENGISNQKFFENLAGYIAYVLQYSNFKLEDKSRNIVIEVICEKDKKKIESMIINGKNDYYNEENSKKQIEKYEEIPITEMKINSNVLKKLINNKWNISSTNFGTKESTFEKYDIYFDEGIEARKLGTKIFNVIFTDKYTDLVVNNIKVGETFENIEKILGKPTFESQNIIGYKGKNIYVFFENNTISVYRVEEEENEDFTELINKLDEYESYQKVANALTDIWSDYDYSENNSNSIILRYSLIGIELINNSSKQGIVLYRNYTGKIKNDKSIKDINTDEIPNNVYIDNENDLVYLTEINRVSKIENQINYYSNIVMSEDEQNKINDLSTKFKYVVIDNKKVNFYSVDNDYPKCELEADLNSYMWYDDYKFIYSVKNEGIYVYNLQTRKNTKLKEGNDEFTFKSYNSKILTYDDNKTLSFK